MPKLNVVEKPEIIYDAAAKSQSIERDCDCASGDCACDLSAPAEILDSFHLLPLSEDTILVRSPDSNHLRLDENYVVCYGPYHRTAVLNNLALELIDMFTYPTPLKYVLTNFPFCTPESVISAIENLFATKQLVVADGKDFKLHESVSTLTAWLHITDRCNLRCTYCYLPHKREDMSLEIGRAVIDTVFRSAQSHGYKQIKLKYAGGEPLICFSLVTELHSYAQQIAYSTGIALDGIILSNGTLLNEEIISSIIELRLRLMVSLDGLEDAHNQQRFFNGGKPSFNHVSQGIELAVKFGLRPDISITVSSRNAKSLYEVITWILNHDLPFSLNFYRENDLSTSYTDLKLSEEKIIAGMLAAYDVIETNLPRRKLLSSLVDRANLSSPHLHTCGAGHHYLVFDYRGQVSKCQMHLNQPITSIEINDPLSFIRNDQIGIQNISVEEKEGCKECEWRYWCTGGCPLNTFRATGRYDIKSPNCHIYKALYPQAIRLEGLRLLRYGSVLD